MAARIDLHTNRLLHHQPLLIEYRKTKAQISWDLHSHEGYEIYFFQKGKANYIIGSAVYSLTAGDLLIFKGDTMHHAKPTLDVPYGRTVLNFKLSYITDVLPSSMMEQMEYLLNKPGGQLVRWSEVERPEIEKLLFQISSENDKRVVGYDAMIKAYFVQLLVKIYRAANSLEMQTQTLHMSQKESNVQEVLKIINDRFQEDLSLDDMAELVHLNKHYMCHCFKEVTGFTVNQYLTKRRVDEAKKVLLTTNISIGRVSEMIGLNNSIQFSRLFKQHVGVSPQSFRKIYKTTPQNEGYSSC